jgi:hypothetical protein
LEHQPDHKEAKAKLAELEAQNRRNQRPRRNTPRRNTRSDTGGDTSSQAKSAAVKGGPPADPAEEILTRADLFSRGVDRYREGNYAQAFEAFLACLGVQGRDPLPAGSLAGEAGPLWKGFRTRPNVPSEARLLAEAVRFNPADRSLYVNLSLVGAKMGIDRKTLRRTLDRVHLHALERRQ